MSTVEDDFVPATEEYIRGRIIHVLTIYPGISSSMLQVGIGTALGPKLWHPVMDRLKASGRVVETEIMAQAPNGRDLTYKHLTLVPESQSILGVDLTKAELNLLADPDWSQLTPTNTSCSVCGEHQYETPGGITCQNGHGGAEVKV